MPLFGKPKRAVISKEVYVRARCVSPKGRGRAGTVQDERCAPAAPSLEGNCAPSSAGNSLKDIQLLQNGFS